MLLVGLTGGIAAGKSVVAARLKTLGVPVIDADESSRHVVTKGSAGLQAVVAAFGTDILDNNGNLNRVALGARVFSDQNARKQLESILHPLIANDVMQQIIDLQAAGHELVVVDAALMVETGSYRNYPVLVVVYADDDLRVRRIVARDGLSEPEAHRRLAAQAPQAQKIELAHYTINNNGTLEETHSQVDQLLKQLRAQYTQYNNGA